MSLAPLYDWLECTSTILQLKEMRVGNLQKMYIDTFGSVVDLLVRHTIGIVKVCTANWGEDALVGRLNGKMQTTEAPSTWG